MRRKFTFVYQQAPEAIVTGGHIFESKMARGLADIPDNEVEVLSAGSVTGLLTKLFAPLRNITLLPRLLHRERAENNTILFNSSKFLYFLPLVLLLRMNGVRTIAIHHHFISNEIHGIKRLLFRPIELLFLRACREVIAPSPYMKSEIKRLTGKTPLYIPTPCPSPHAQEKDSRDEEINILFTGTIEPRKGLIYAIEALGKVHHEGKILKFHIAGKTVDRDYRKELDAAIHRQGLHDKVIFHGFIPRAELDLLYRKADIYLFPSLQEGFGLAIAEAMAWGLPTVAFDNSAMPYIVSDGVTGLLVPTGDIKRLADAIGRMTDDTDFRRKASANALAASAALPHHTDFLAALNTL